MTTFAVGVFGDPRVSIDQRILYAQATLLAISFGALILAALFGERRLHEIALLEREARLEDALRAGGMLAFDWDLLAERRSDEPAIVAGGLTPENVATAIDVTHPYAVDVASGVEAEPGRKDHALLAAFFDAARDGAPSPQ